MIKYDNLGIHQWNCTWGGTSMENYPELIISNSSDDIYLGGATRSFGSGGWDMFIVKYNNNNGIQQWNRTFGGLEDDCFEGLALDSSENILLGVLQRVMDWEDWICL